MRTKALLPLLLLPLLAAAHPGHGHTEGHSFWHYFLEPQHALPALLLAAGLGIWLYRRHAQRENEA